MEQLLTQPELSKYKYNVEHLVQNVEFRHWEQSVILFYYIE